MEGGNRFSILLRITGVMLVIVACHCTKTNAESPIFAQYVDYLKNEPVYIAEMSSTERKLAFEDRLKWAPELIKENSIEDISMVYDNIFYQQTKNRYGEIEEIEQADKSELEKQLDIIKFWMSKVNELVQNGKAPEDELFNPRKNKALLDLLSKQVYEDENNYTSLIETTIYPSNRLLATVCQGFDKTPNLKTENNNLFFAHFNLALLIAELRAGDLHKLGPTSALNSILNLSKLCRQLEREPIFDQDLKMMNAIERFIKNNKRLPCTKGTLKQLESSFYSFDSIEDEFVKVQTHRGVADKLAEKYVSDCLKAFEYTVMYSLLNKYEVVTVNKVQEPVIYWFNLVVRFTVGQCRYKQEKNFLKRSRLLKNPNIKPKTIDCHNVMDICEKDADGVDYLYTLQEVLDPNQNKYLKYAMDRASGTKGNLIRAVNKINPIKMLNKSFCTSILENTELVKVREAIIYLLEDATYLKNLRPVDNMIELILEPSGLTVAKFYLFSEMCKVRESNKKQQLQNKFLVDCCASHKQTKQ